MGFSDVATTIGRELVATVKNPYRAHKLLRPQKLRGFLNYLNLHWALGNTWTTEQRFQHRTYRAYEDYLKHQVQKLNRANLAEDLGRYDVEYRRALAERVSDLELHGRSVLCLAARIGTEVKGFRDRGAFAVGLDLNPGTGNQYVFYGDFHDVKFSDGSVEYAFTNSLDHVFDITKFMAEVRRVLKRNGMFIVEAMIGVEGGKTPGFYESFYWATCDDLARLIEQSGFAVSVRKRITYPYDGEHLRFVKVD